MPPKPKTLPLAEQARRLLADYATKEQDAAHAAQTLAQLADLLPALDAAYHQNDAPLVDDATYDSLRRLNTELETRFPDQNRADSPAQQVARP